MKAPPPFETWIIMGDFAFLAASRQAFAEDELKKKGESQVWGIERIPYYVWQGKT